MITSPVINTLKGVFMTMVCGLCAISLGSLIVGVDPYSIIFRMKVVFTDGGETFVMWQKPEVELYLKVYLFNVTNRDAFLAGKEKLRVQQTGPYVYREFLTHGNVTFNENGTITAIPFHPLTYMPELSNGTEEDKHILPNIALLSFAHVTSTASFITRFGVNTLIKSTKSEPLVEMTAREFMFGYQTTLVTLGNKLLPSWISFEKLGLIDRMYDFDGDTSTTFTGDTDLRMSGLLDNYNGKTTLPQWEAPCNNISGASDGTKFNSLIQKNQTLKFFRKSMCRPMPLEKVGEEVVSGLHGYRYHFKTNALDNGEVNPDNKCYCRKKICLPYGLIDVTQCYYGFPIALSYPHFLGVDPKVQSEVEGLNPSEEKHGTYFVINEESGLPLNVSVKMQINMALGDLSKMDKVKKFSHMVLPMLWTDIMMPGLPDSMSTRFYIYLNVGRLAQTLATYIFLVGGVAFILLSLASAILIPKMSLISSNRNLPENPDWRPQPAKKRTAPQPPPGHHSSKEMELYYCSLLAVNEEQ